jgi:hypothetical protein
MRSFILAPTEASTYHHVPMSCPPLKSIHSTIFSRSGLLLQTLRLNTLPPKRAIPAKWAPLAAVSKPRDLRSDKNLVYPCRLTKSSRTASQDQWAQTLLACRSVAWQYMDREIVQVFKYKFPQSLARKPGSPSNNFIFRVPFRTRAGLIARRSLVLNTILIAVILELTSLGEKSPTPPFIVKSQTLHNKWLIRKFIDDNVCRDFKTRPRRRRIIKLSDVRFLHGY